MRNPTSRGKFSYNFGPAIAGSEAKPIPPPVVQAAPAQPQPDRHTRRTNKVFNRRLKRALKKDNSAVEVEILADGGIHVTVDTREDSGEE
jgi:hypothetical protein